MPEQIYIGNASKGQITSRLPFVIDNDAFPTLFNFYTWRGRVKRKRGTKLLDQMRIQVQSVLTATPPANYQVGQILILDGAGNGAGNLIAIFGLPSTSTIAAGTIHFFDGVNTYTDPARDGNLLSAPGVTGTINYATGAITISNGNPAGILRGAPGVVTFEYFPGNVSEGQRDFVQANESQYPLLLSFDVTNAYQVNQVANPTFYNVTFYKTSQNPFVWSAPDSQQFWTTNYSGALWATNGKAGLHFKNIQSIVWNSATQLTIVILGAPGVPPVVVGDLVWTNQITTNSAVNTAAKLDSVNGQTGSVAIIVEAPPGTFTLTVNFPSSAIIDPAAGDPGKVYQNGIIQLLTASIAGQDGIKWYDGDPTNGTGIPSGTGLGWVNFAPPLTALTVSIANTPAALYYLIGALAILPFKDRLLFFNPIIGTTNGVQIQLQDVVIWSWNGTPYYASPVPINQTFDVRAYYVDQTGLGGYLPAGIDAPLTTISNNEDVLLLGFGGARGRKTRFVYSGNDLDPFLFFNINSELPSTSTFSAVTLDKGAIDIGTYGITLTDQQSCSRIDLDIPDSVFQISNNNDGFKRVNSVRDFQKEWIYFSYPPTNAFADPITKQPWIYPTQTFLFNYRDNTWAILYENYTSRGTFRYETGETWATLPYNNWSEWVDPWSSGTVSAKFPSIVGGTPQGYVQVIGEGTSESASATIYDILPFSGGLETQIKSINHCLASSNPNTANGDYIYITGIIGLKSSIITAITLGTTTIITTANTFVNGNFVTINGVVGTTQLNGNTYKIITATAATIEIAVNSTTFTPYVSGGSATSAINGLIGKVIKVIDKDNFVIDLPSPVFTTVYLGLGVFAKLSQPLMQTKQFNPYWDQGRQVRLSCQKYLMDFTPDAQVTVNVYLSQNPDTIWNAGPFVPNPDTFNSSLVYTQLMYTCPESTNIGLTPANNNLQMPTAESQYQIWHRFNTSLIGDSVQIGITLSDAQMRSLDYATAEITLHGMHLTVDKASHLA